MPTKTCATEAERQARREADRKRTAAAVEALKTTDGSKRWLACRRHFHQYSFANQLLIADQCPDATHVAGFRAWLTLGYAVRKGQKALWIWMPIPPTKQALAEWQAAGAAPNQRPKTRFRMGPVFDRSQVDPLPAPAQPVALEPPIASVEGDDLGWTIDPLMELAAGCGYSVVFELMPERYGGCCIPATHRIAINARKPVKQQVKTLVHELGHMLFRVEQADDNLELTYSQEELVVESIAFTFCGSVGLDTSAFSIPYLAGWSERAGMDTIQRAAGMIDRVAKRIEEQVLRSE